MTSTERLFGYQHAFDHPVTVWVSIVASGLAVIGTVAVLTLLLSFPAVLAIFPLAVSIAAQRAVRRAVLIGMLAVSLWVIGFQLARWDPAQVWYWLFD